MTSPTRLIAAAAVAAGSLLSCSDDDPVERARARPPETSAAAVTSPPVESPTPGLEGSCANEAQVTANPLARIAGPLIGDVTGDGTPERIYLSLDEAAPGGCQLFVVVSDASPASAPVDGWDPMAGVTSPTLNGLAQIDGRPGAEIVVNLAAGASTQFVGAFSASGGIVERLATSGGDETSDLFAFGGSVGHLEAVDCTADGMVVLSSAIPKGDRYRVTREFYTPSGATLEVQSPDTERSIISLNDLQDLPEFAASPFGTCPPA